MNQAPRHNEKKMGLGHLRTGSCATAAAVMMALALTIAASATSKETTLYTFCSVQNCADGDGPASGVIFDQIGSLYGTTNIGGLGWGTVFQLVQNAGGGWTENVLYAFTSPADGDGPNSLVFDNTGNLYGTTIYGGGTETCINAGCGTLFELIHVHGGWTKKVLHKFVGGNKGALPLAGVVRDTAGNWYGTTSQGGTHGVGTVYELTHSTKGWTETVIHSFAGGSDGSTPMAGLIFDQAGNLFGTTNQGGNSNLGVVFELKRTNQRWKETVLHSFAGNGQDGASPYSGGLALDQAGNLYGTTSRGGANGLGTVFELVRSKQDFKERVLHSFGHINGGFVPYAGVLIDAAGNLYGATSSAGSGGDGTIFTLRGTGGKWDLTVLYRFNGSNGSQPVGNLVFDGAGNFYGTAQEGGDNHTGAGVVFEITP
jgi:uncharacterized repeat protein (TIGR03803 family)